MIKSSTSELGAVVNSQIVRGQVHGATCHGPGAALVETLDYDEGGNLMTSTFADYTPIVILY